MSPRPWAPVAIPLLLSACTGGADGPRLTVVDSAGVEIVTMRSPAWAPGTEWRLGAAPLVVVPPETGSYSLAGVHSAIRLDDGSLVVANGGENRLLFFDPAGTLAGAAGRPGSGPGEFRNLVAVWRGRGDSLVAFDWLAARLSVWDGANSARMIPLRSPDGRQVIAWGAWRDGSFLVSRTSSFDPALPSGVHRVSVPFMRYAPDGELLDTLAVLPFREFYRLELDGRMTNTDPPFGREFAVAVLDSGFVYGAAVAAELEVRAHDGRLRRLLRFPARPRPVTDADIALHRRQRIERDEGYGAPRRETERLLSKLTFPDLMPAHDAARVDPDGNVWLSMYEPDPTAPGIWRVLSPAGDYLGEVAIPPRVHILDVGTDYVLGRLTDALDRESLVVFRLEKGRQPEARAGSPQAAWFATLR